MSFQGSWAGGSPAGRIHSKRRAWNLAPPIFSAPASMMPKTFSTSVRHSAYSGDRARMAVSSIEKCDSPFGHCGSVMRDSRAFTGIDDARNLLDFRARFAVPRRPRQDGSIFDREVRLTLRPLRQCHARFEGLHRREQVVEIGAGQFAEPLRAVLEQPLFGGKKHVAPGKLLAHGGREGARQPFDDRLVRLYGLHTASSGNCAPRA